MGVANGKVGGGGVTVKGTKGTQHSLVRELSQTSVSIRRKKKAHTNLGKVLFLFVSLF